MNEFLAITPIIVFAILAALAIAAIMMPIYVICIDHKVGKIQRSLAAMERMMRHGK